VVDPMLDHQKRSRQTSHIVTSCVQPRSTPRTSKPQSADSSVVRWRWPSSLLSCPTDPGAPGGNPLCGECREQMETGEREQGKGWPSPRVASQSGTVSPAGVAFVVDYEPRSIRKVRLCASRAKALTALQE
jgi:hypothetical protein